jgi:acetolactate synthase-1/2/3 large subunit
VGAFQESTPCLIVSGQVKRVDLKGDSGVRMLGAQEVDIVSMVQSVTKYAVTILDPESIRFHMEKAYYLATSGRPGPVWIDVPLDVQAAKIDPDALVGFDPSAAAAQFDEAKASSQIGEVIDLLNRAERPVLLAGAGIRISGGCATFRQLVETLQIPVLTTWLGIDLLAYDHPCVVGRIGSVAPRGPNFALQNSDLMIAIGARLGMTTVGYSHANLARAASKVLVDIDPAEMAKMPPPVTAVHADATFFMRELLARQDSIARRDRTGWSARCQGWKNRYPLVQPEYEQQTEGVSTYILSETISAESAERDVIVAGSSGNAIEIFLLAYRPKAGQRVLHTRGLGAMGFALPAAIGACLARGCARTICVDGDGGFQMNIQELEVVRRLQLPIKFFVVNNQGYASIRASQKNNFGKLTGADASSGMTLPDVKCVAAAYGLPTVRISSQERLGEQIAGVIGAEGPVVCEVIAPPDEPRAPRIMSRRKNDGAIVSTPLEDLWPFLSREELRANMLVPMLEE